MLFFIVLNLATYAYTMYTCSTGTEIRKQKGGCPCMHCMSLYIYTRIKTFKVISETISHIIVHVISNYLCYFTQDVTGILAIAKIFRNIFVTFRPHLKCTLG